MLSIQEKLHIIKKVATALNHAPFPQPPQKAEVISISVST
jgi:hypothetical protein